MDQIKLSTYKPTEGPSCFQKTMQVGKNNFFSSHSYRAQQQL